MGKYEPKKDLLTGEFITQETFENIHEKPLRTRREFLAAGLIQMTATVSLPSLVSMMANSGNARAQEIVCPKGSNTSLVPFITVNLAGGAGLAANYVPMDRGGQPLSTYSRLGLGTAPAILTDFANQAPFVGGASPSGFHTGLTTTAQAGTVMSSAFVAAPMRTRDDSDENKLNLEGLVAKAGRSGTILPHLGRNRNEAAFVTPPNPLNVGRFSNIQEALQIGGRLGDRLNKTQQGRLFSAIENLTKSQTRSIASKSGGAELHKLVNCATKDNKDLINTDDPGVNPINDPAFLAVWGIDPDNPNMNSNAFTQASIVYNVIRGNAAAGTINLGGYDYHNGTRTSGDARDTQAGAIVGRVLESFAVLGVKGFIAVTTDGSVTGPASDLPGGVWTSDRGSAGMAYMLAYNPGAPPQTSGFSMGHFLGGASQQAVDQSFITSGTPEMGAAGIFANYLSFSGQIELLDAVLPRTFSTEDLDNILKIYG